MLTTMRMFAQMTMLLLLLLLQQQRRCFVVVRRVLWTGADSIRDCAVSIIRFAMSPVRQPSRLRPNVYSYSAFLFDQKEGLFLVARVPITCLAFWRCTFLLSLRFSFCPPKPYCYVAHVTTSGAQSPCC